ncbi:MAG: MFS transporter [Bacteroidetes bacterium]|nr:MAG: MFS transporter [Bacteroidota bacterium]
MKEKGKGLLKATLLIASTLTVMAGAIIAPALPQISRDFSHVQGVELLSRLVLTLPALFMAILAPLAGYLIDKSGRKRVLLVSLVLYAIAGTSGLYLNTLPAILVGRAFLGIAVGGIVTAVITLIGDYFEGEERSRFVGTQAAFAGLGGLVFISSGGILADIHWRMPFLIYVSSLLVWIMALISVYEPEKIKHKASPPMKGSGKKEANFVPAKVLWICAIAFFSAIVFYMIPVQMPFMLSSMEGVSNAEIGFAIAFVNVASVTTSLNYSRIKRRLGFGTIMGLVYVIIFTGFFIISLGGSYILMIAGIAVTGLGFGMMMPNINLWLISSAPPSLRGRFVGYLNSSLFLGMFLSPVAVQPLIKISSINHSFLLMGLIMLVLAGVFFAYGRKKKTP